MEVLQQLFTLLVRKVLLLEGTTLYVRDPDEALKALDLCESVRSYDYKINSKILSRIPLCMKKPVSYRNQHQICCIRPPLP